MRKTTLLTFFAGFFLSSCTHYYYVPATQNIPLFKEKNEARVLAAYGGGSESSAVELQAAYSLTNNLAVMTNFISARGGNLSAENWGKGNYAEGAVGYYKPFDSAGVFEVFGGVGAGSQQHRYATANYFSTSRLGFTKLFIQPSLGLTFRGFDVAFSTRVCNLNFWQVRNQIDPTNSNYLVVNDISQARNSVLLEPAITIRGGWKYVKLQLQFLTSSNLTNRNLAFEKVYGSAGIYFTLAKRYKQ